MFEARRCSLAIRARLVAKRMSRNAGPARRQPGSCGRMTLCSKLDSAISSCLVKNWSQFCKQLMHARPMGFLRCRVELAANFMWSVRKSWRWPKFYFFRLPCGRHILSLHISSPISRSLAQWEHIKKRPPAGSGRERPAMEWGMSKSRGRTSIGELELL